MTIVLVSASVVSIGFAGEIFAKKSSDFNSNADMGTQGNNTYLTQIL
ncbi:MAG TPA: hypothetical protein VIY08_03150 [Candidatus Nitrosocosmicus sp.]